MLVPVAAAAQEAAPLDAAPMSPSPGAPEAPVQAPAAPTTQGPAPAPATAAMQGPAPASTAAGPQAQPPPAAVVDPMVAAASPDPANRIGAIPGLLAHPNPQARAVLLTMLRVDVDPGVRRAVAEALGGSHDGDLAPVLGLAARTDPDPGVREAGRLGYDRLWPWRKRPGTAAALSVLCPGCGFFYLREPGRGALHLGATTALIAGGLALLGDDTSAGISTASSDAADPIGLQLLMAGQNAWFYGVFASYQEAHRLRDEVHRRAPVPRDSLLGLVSAPFRPSVLRRSWVWAGTPILLGAALGLSAAVDSDSFPADRTLFDGGGVNFLGHQFGTGAGFALGEGYYGALFIPVAVGEEALFRGLLQTELSERLGTWQGWALASLLFGGIHVFNFTGDDGSMADAAWAVPYITLTGSYLGLAYAKTGSRLETSVAIHFWYDFLLSTASFVADPDNQPFVVEMAVPF